MYFYAESERWRLATIIFQEVAAGKLDIQPSHQDIENFMQNLLNRRAQVQKGKIASYEDEMSTQLTTTPTIPPPLLDHVVEAFRTKYYLMKSLQNNIEEEQAKVQRKKSKQFAKQQKRIDRQKQKKPKHHKEHAAATTEKDEEDDQFMEEMEKIMRDLKKPGDSESVSDERPVMRIQDRNDFTVPGGLTYDIDEEHLRIPFNEI